MKKTLSIVLCVLLVLLAVACSPETHEHDYKLVKEKSFDATCTTEGLEYWECECGAREFMWTAPDANAHKMVLDEDNAKNKDATCAETGLAVYECAYGCGKTEEETLAKVSTNHPAGKTIFKSTKVAATCASTGVDIVECTACGEKNAEQVTKKTDGHYYLDEDDSSQRHTVEQSDVVSWTTTTEPNAFLTGKKEGKCPTCGEVAFEDIDIDYASSEILGTWTMTYGSAAGSSPTYNYYNVTISKDSNGIYSVEAYKNVVTSGVAESTKLTATDVGFVPNESLKNSVNLTLADGSRGFKFTCGSDYYYVTLAKASTDSSDRVYLQICEGTNDTVDKYGTSVSSTHTHSWTRVEKSKIGTSYHYVNCSGCNVKCLRQTHNFGECSVCGDTSTGWYKVSVKYDQNKAASAFETADWSETFWMKSGDAFAAVTNPSSSSWTPADVNEAETGLGAYNSIITENTQSAGTNLLTNKSGENEITVTLGGSAES